VNWSNTALASSQDWSCSAVCSSPEKTAILAAAAVRPNAGRAPASNTFSVWMSTLLSVADCTAARKCRARCSESLWMPPRGSVDMEDGGHGSPFAGRRRGAGPVVCLGWAEVPRCPGLGWCPETFTGCLPGGRGDRHDTHGGAETARRIWGLTPASGVWPARLSGPPRWHHPGPRSRTSPGGVRAGCRSGR
jgi:hypothetical protein